MEEKNINTAESLQIIDSMINTAKNKLADDGFLFIFWGWLVFIAAMTNYICIVLNIPNGFWAWVILMPLGGIVSMLYSRMQKKKEKVKTYIDTYLGYSWIAFLIAMFINLAFMENHGIKGTYFFFMLLYGTATFISGGLLNFKPMLFGSLFSFVFAILSVYLGEKEQFLCISASLLCSYIIPGHLLHAKFKSQVNV